MSGRARSLAEAQGRQLRLFDFPQPQDDATPSARTRWIMLAGQPVNWALQRSQRRTIGIIIDRHGLRVSAPRWVTLTQIEHALVEKSGWILRKLAEWRQQSAQRQHTAQRWEDGAPLRVLGQALTMRLDPTADGVLQGDDSVLQAGDTLKIGLPSSADAEQVRTAVQTWLQQRARAVFAERIPVYANRLGRAPRRWTLSSARTRWGSCSADGTIRLNWRLVHFPLEIVDYVIAHELAHLLEMNHGPRFWATVAKLLPEFETARDWLRRAPDPSALPPHPSEP